MASDPAGPIFGRDSPDAAWRPTPELLQDSRLARFLHATGEPSLEALQARAVADPGWFWGAAADDIGIAWQRRPSEVLDASRGPAWARWWGGGAFDYARAATEPRATSDPGGEALVWEGEDGAVRRLTNGELLAEVDAAVRRFRAHGVRAGDRVGILLPLLPETVITVLALGRIGAIYTPIFSGYAAPAVATRLADCDASVLVTADGFPAPGLVGVAQGGRGRSRGPRADGSPDGRRPPSGRCCQHAVEPGPRRVVARGTFGARSGTTAT
jgi:acetyl-CoA synthetase